MRCGNNGGPNEVTKIQPTCRRRSGYWSIWPRRPNACGNCRENEGVDGGGARDRFKKRSRRPSGCAFICAKDESNRRITTGLGVVQQHLHCFRIKPKNEETKPFLKLSYSQNAFVLWTILTHVRRCRIRRTSPGLQMNSVGRACPSSATQKTSRSPSNE